MILVLDVERSSCQSRGGTVELDGERKEGKVSSKGFFSFPSASSPSSPRSSRELDEREGSLSHDGDLFRIVSEGGSSDVGHEEGREFWLKVSSNGGKEQATNLGEVAQWGECGGEKIFLDEQT